MNAINQALTQL